MLRRILKRLAREVERGDSEPLSEGEALLRDLWCDALGLRRIGRHDDFFDLGGDSLLVADIVSKARRAGLNVVSSHFFERRTLAGIATSARAEEKPASDDFAADARLDDDIVATAPPARAARKILLTGATGFLGGHLLAELLHRSEATIWCLVRARSEVAGLEKLRVNLKKRGLWRREDEGRLVILPGTLARPRLDLSDEAFSSLAREIDVVYHNGALVNLIAPYSQLRTTNVHGTREILRLATRDVLKRVHYVSTLSVFGAAGVVREGDSPAAAASLRFGYAQSKATAEALIAAARARGVPVTVYRPGAISDHSTRGVLSETDLLATFLRACVAARSVPDVNRKLDFAPVDFVAAAVVALSLAGETATEEGPFHLVNPAPAGMKELAGHLDAELVSFDEWKRRIPTEVLGGLSPLFAFMSQEDLERTPELDVRDTIRRVRELGIECPPVDERLVRSYVMNSANAALAGRPVTARQEANTNVGVEITIRRASEDDLEALVDFNCEMARETERKELSRPTVTEGVRAVLQNAEHGFYLVAEHEGDVVGDLLVTREWSDWRNGLFWWIQSVYVKSPYRRRGIYRRLYLFLKDEAKKAGNVCGFRLYVEKDNEIAQETYASLGMAETYYRLFEAAC